MSRLPFRIAVIGGGISSIAALYHLRKQGFRDVTVFEAAESLGGTWFHTRYPGAEVDTGSFLYSFSFSPHAWSRSHAAQPEILQYLNDTVDRFDLRSRYELSTRIVSVVWDDSALSYTVTAEDGRTWEFDAVISAVGFLSAPRLPGWAAESMFAGEQFHSAQWPEDFDPTGKTIAVVGTGSTAVQIVATMAEEAERVIVFQREPNWVIPKNIRTYDQAQRARLRKAHHARRLRYREFMASERGRFRGLESTPGTRANLRMARIARQHMLRQLAGRDDLIAACTPDYPYWGTRPGFSDAYYPALARDNVTLVPRAVESMDRTGVIDTDGVHHDADVVVYATGFRAAEYLHGLEVVGEDGRRLHSVWGDDPEAFLGMMVPGFSNFFMLYGPNTNTGSLVYMFERQAEFVARSLRRAVRRGRRIVEVRPVAHRLYNSWVQRALGGSAWASSQNYFRSASGKVVTQWPGTATTFATLARVTRPWAVRSR